MDAVEFLKQYSRMVTFGVQPFKVPSNLPYEEIVSRVEQWSKEHPVKTRQSELLKLFPNAKIDNAGTLCMCPMNFNPETYKDKDKCFCIHMRDDIHCAECRRDFWLQEVQ